MTRPDPRDVAACFAENRPRLLGDIKAVQAALASNDTKGKGRDDRNK